MAHAVRTRDGQSASPQPKSPKEMRYCTKRMLRSTINAISPSKPRPESMTPLPPTRLPPPVPARPASSPPRVSDSGQSVVAPFPTLDPVCTPVELSNYPPSLTEEDVWGLFSDFHIAQFQLPNHHRWTKPLRLRVDVSGAGEAERAVKELDGFVLEGRRITVKLVDGKKYEEQEVVSDEMADEVKVQIFNTARVLFNQHTTKILDIREWMTATVY